LEIEDLDEYEKKIHDYILANGPCTENSVRQAKLCAPMWARKKIKSLIANGFVEDRKVGNGFHRLYISDRTEFNRINKTLKDIDKYIDTMYVPVKQIRQLISDPQSRFLGQVYFAKFFDPYIAIVSTMLRTLLLINNEKMPMQTSTELNLKIGKLIQKHTEWAYDLDDSRKIMAIYKDTLNKTKEQLENDPTAQNSFYNIPMIRILIKKVELFEKNFLT